LPRKQAVVCQARKRNGFLQLRLSDNFTHFRHSDPEHFRKTRLRVCFQSHPKYPPRFPHQLIHGNDSTIKERLCQPAETQAGVMLAIRGQQSLRLSIPESSKTWSDIVKESPRWDFISKCSVTSHVVLLRVRCDGSSPWVTSHQSLSRGVLLELRYKLFKHKSAILHHGWMEMCYSWMTSRWW
jgi:hypothetical protein